jgi:hypothetical protein
VDELARLVTGADGARFLRIRKAKSLLLNARLTLMMSPMIASAYRH